jgi:hypothetical protein
MNDSEAYQIRKTLYSYRTNPEIFAVKTQDSERARTIQEMQELDWTSAAKERKAILV